MGAVPGPLFEYARLDCLNIDPAALQPGDSSPSPLRKLASACLVSSVRAGRPGAVSRAAFMEISLDDPVLSHADAELLFDLTFTWSGDLKALPLVKPEQADLETVDLEKKGNAPSPEVVTIPRLPLADDVTVDVLDLVLLIVVHAPLEAVGGNAGDRRLVGSPDGRLRSRAAADEMFPIDDDDVDAATSSPLLSPRSPGLSPRHASPRPAGSPRPGKQQLPPVIPCRLLIS